LFDIIERGLYQGDFARPWRSPMSFVTASPAWWRLRAVRTPENLIAALRTTGVPRELLDGHYVNLGIGIPTPMTNYIPAGIKVVLQSVIGMHRATPGRERNGGAFEDLGAIPFSAWCNA
jgi:hypothetical protein